MHISLVSWTILLSIPFASAQLNILAKESGKIYFGSATDNPELTDAPYVKQLGNTQDFGQLTPVGYTHIMSIFVIDSSPGEQHEMGMTCFIFDMHALLNSTVQSMQLNQLEVILRLQLETKSWIWPRKTDNSFEVHKVFREAKNLLNEMICPQVITVSGIVNLRLGLLQETLTTRHSAPSSRPIVIH
jgi:hypothetical protein